LIGRASKRSHNRQSAGKGKDNVKNIEEVQQLGKENMDATLKSVGAWSKSIQAIAIEMADYSKRAFEQGTAATEKLMGAKSLDKAFEVQSDYLKNCYEGYVAQATKIGELYADLAKEAYKPFENQFGKFASVK
jgi:hypothetical protein